MDFVILSVNGRDVSNSSHEEAVRCFETAQEPITIQVLRKQSINRSNQHKIDTKIDNYEPNKSSLNFISTSVQTELAGLINEDYADNYYVFEDGDDYDEDNVEEEEEEEEYDEMTNIRDCKLREDVYFEEVTLRKCTSQEKLGLTVCYNYACEKDNNTDIPEVYISEILKDSLAGRDGRLREGDQILQVNGKDIESKEQTERVFSQIKNTVVILVSRCLYQTSLPNSPDNVPAYQNSMIELLLQLQKRQYEGTTTTTLDSIDKNDVGAFSTSTSSSPPPPPVPLHNNPSVSGLNNSLTSTSSSSQNSHTSNKDSNSSSIQFSTDKNPNNFNETLKESIKKIDDLSIGVKTKICGGRILKNTSDTEHIYETIPESDNEPIYSSPYESKTIVHEHRSKSSTKSNSSIEEKDNSSSAYNTGESCNSNPLVLELQKSTDTRELHGSTLVLCQSDNNTPTTMTPSIYFNPPPNCDIAANQIVRSIQASLSAPQFNNYQSTTIDKDDKKQAPINSCQHHCYHNHHPQYQYYQYYQPHHQPNKINNRNLNNWGELNNRDKDTHSIGSSVLYTNIDHSEQSAMLQQQIFTQALNRKNIIKDDCRDRDDKSRGKFRAPNLTQYHFIGSQQQVRQSNTMSMQEDKCDPHMEWKVKRRPDGTRYIVRRPVRNRLLGNRTLEISEERAGQTTEDDTVSEIKLGRYWTKEERKRHLEQARQRKQRHQAVLRQQFKQHENSLNINHADEETNSTTMRKSNCQDTTGVNQNSNRIDHNIHCGGNGKPSVGLLSVTTV